MIQRIPFNHFGGVMIPELEAIEAAPLATQASLFRGARGAQVPQNRTPTELLMSYSLMTRSIFSPCLCFALLGPGLP